MDLISPWREFAEQVGISNLVPIARPQDGIETKLAPGVVGKVPSVYNRKGELVGFKDWQKCRVTEREISRWQRDSRYGFGVILGQPVPAGGVAVCIDVDTENKAEQATVETVIREWVGAGTLPRRVRENSARQAYLLRVTGAEQPITKRVLKLREHPATKKPEAIEILGYGQQFAAWGVHPSGADLQWLDGDAESLTASYCWPDLSAPELTITVDELGAMIGALAKALGVDEATQLAARRRAAGSVDAPADDVARFLDENGWTLSVGIEGERRIRSPFADEYTNEQDDNDSSVVYYSAGTGTNAATGGAFEQGHFVSLHASDANRGDQDFLDAVGYIAAQFDDLPAIPGEAPLAPNLNRDKSGKAFASLTNVLAGLGSFEWLGYEVRFDTFRGEMVIRRAGKDAAWRPLEETDYTWLRVALEARGFHAVGKEMIRDAVHAIGRQLQIDTARDWLTGLEWDGEPRVEHFFERYFRVTPPEDASDTEREQLQRYAAACSLYAWSALAGRVMEPGVKADMMPILVGPQGCGKSTGVLAIAPDQACFAELSFSDRDDDIARRMRGKLVVELGEMNGLRSRQIESIKAQVSRTHDQWVPKYQELATQYARRCLMFGTSNEHDLLDDMTGNRRFLPMDCGVVDVEGIERDRDQLWAEARELFASRGVIYADVMPYAEKQREVFNVQEPLTDVVEGWLSCPDELSGEAPQDRPYVTTTEVILALAGGHGLRLDQGTQRRVAVALRTLGYSSARARTGGRQLKVYKKEAVFPV